MKYILFFLLLLTSCIGPGQPTEVDASIKRIIYSGYYKDYVTKTLDEFGHAHEFVGIRGERGDIILLACYHENYAEIVKVKIYKY